MAYEVLVVTGGRGARSYECYGCFLRSLDRHSMRPIFVPGPWNGMTAKIKNLWAYLQSGAHTGKYVLTTDAYDVVFGSPALKNPNDLWPTLIERFKSLDADIVYNAEKNCFPFPELAPHFPDHGKKTFAYLNSGFILGYTEAVVEALRHMRPEELRDDYQDERGNWVHPADQECHQMAFIDQPVKMKLDSDAILCQTTHDVDASNVTVGERYDSTNGGIYLRIAHQESFLEGPLAWHFNEAKRHDVMSMVLKSLRL